ncbi:MAG: tetratricopeptide repeat protein, partial [Planctomycetota bacterium]
DIPAAEQYFNDALRSDPRFVDALLGLAALKFNNGDRVNAQRLLERVDAALIGRGPGSNLPDHLRAELDQLRPLRD